MTARETDLTEQLAQCRAALAESQRENALLRQKIDLLVRRVFGARSEALDAAQLELLLSLPAAATVVEAPVVPSVPELTVVRSRKDRTPRLPDNLPVVEEVIEPEPVKAQPAAWRCIGQEVSEQLDYEPARFLRRRTIRRKYVHRTDADHAPVIAALPERLQDRSLPAPGLLAQVLVSKYCDHLPLYRQERIFSRRHQVQLLRQTLARWVALAADWLNPFTKASAPASWRVAMCRWMRPPWIIWIPVMARRGKVISGRDIVRVAMCFTAGKPAGPRRIWRRSFPWTSPARSNATATPPIARRFAKGRGEAIALAGCWAHVRRKFHEALESSPRIAGWILRQIQHLCRVEAELREQQAGPQLRAAVRAWQSRPLVTRLQRVLIQLKSSERHLPQSLLVPALDYALGQWRTLEVFLTDGRVEVDNNLVENAIRPTAIGKNYPQLSVMRRCAWRN